jgi:hypothetical protein
MMIKLWTRSNKGDSYVYDNEFRYAVYGPIGRLVQDEGHWHGTWTCKINNDSKTLDFHKTKGEVEHEWIEANPIIERGHCASTPLGTQIRANKESTSAGGVSVDIPNVRGREQDEGRDMDSLIDIPLIEVEWT